MTHRGRSERTRDRRLARRRADTQGFDTGGGRRSFFRSRWAKMFYVVGLVGLVGGLVPLLLVGGGSSGGVGGEFTPIRRIEPSGEAIGAVEKPSFDAPPAITIDPALDYVVVLELESGVVRIELFDDIAPVHANNFVFLINEGFYDNLTFHRVIEGFVAQGGDPSATGIGGAGYTLPDEAVDGAVGPLSLSGPGLIAMARSTLGASSSQFFITLTPQGQLDRLGFTAFGRVIEGMELIEALTARDPSTLPAPPPGDLIVSATIETMPATDG